MKIAIIGTGIAGNACAWLLNQSHDITVYEKNDYIGGHSNTVQIEGHPPIDTGFIVYNDWTYPNLIALFDQLKVDVEKTDMSFGVSIDQGRLEYSGDSLFAQKKNIFSRRYIKMLLDIMRFYKEAPTFINGDHQDVSLNGYLEQNGYSKGFIEDHILPMAAAIWSTDSSNIGEFPAASFIRFFKNHGLLLLKNRPQWRTVKGGSKNYVSKITENFKDRIKLRYAVSSIYRREHGVEITDKFGNTESYDQVVLACHTDQSLALLSDVNTQEKAVLRSFPYSINKAYLHQDENLMPRSKKVWSSWNYLSSSQTRKVTVSYWMNKLQPSIGNDQDYFVTLNPDQEPQNILYETTYHHPRFTMSAIDGWNQIKTIQGKNHTWFCGAWCGYGFHEDGLSSGLAVAESIGPDKKPWSIEEKSPAGENAYVT